MTNNSSKKSSSPEVLSVPLKNVLTSSCKLSSSNIFSVSTSGLPARVDSIPRYAVAPLLVLVGLDILNFSFPSLIADRISFI